MVVAVAVVVMVMDLWWSRWWHWGAAVVVDLEVVAARGGEWCDHLETFDEKTYDGFFLGYSPVAKAFRIFNIRRQELEETFHVIFNEADDVIKYTSTKRDDINFNKNRSFLDDTKENPKLSHKVYESLTVELIVIGMYRIVSVEISF
nr:retrovirus-related Pol polyprotein from transposon TNT 1-94 [Tanacetum cinerariifolium]